MGLNDIQYQEDYRSGEDNVLNDFFKPSLQKAHTYWRAVGYFSSSALEAFGEPLDEFVKRDGTIRLITSVELTEQDLQAIEKGLSKKETTENRINQVIEEQFTNGVGNGISRLVSLLEIGRLEIKIAVPKLGTGIYHEKVGVFFDEDNYVSFSGSSNESKNAFENNYECIDVYTSWETPSRALRKLKHFEDLWDNLDPGAEIYSFSEALRNKLIRTCTESKEGHIGPDNGTDSDQGEENQEKKWRHQDEAITGFLKKERGILEMATGTGKTRTAIRIIEKLVLSGRIKIIIVSMGGTDLLTQWRGHLNNVRETIKKNGIQITPYYHYDIYHDIEDFNVSTEYRYLLASTNKLHIALKNLDEEQARKTIIVYDEIHNFGSTGNQEKLKGLTENIRYRLGLSATPEREYDKEGTSFIQEHIGPIIYQFGLKDAIERGILSPFNYHSLHYNLDEEDKMAIRNVYAWVAAQKKQGIIVRKEDIWIRLAKVKKLSKQKLPVFKRYLSKHPNVLDRAVVFVEEKYYADYVKDIIQRHTYKYREFFQEDNSSVLRDFSRNRIGTLIACHKISEGIDIKSIKTIILFSAARAKLETIQRIGRSLRTDENDPQKMATVIDFICDDSAKEESSDYERESWLSELSKTKPLGGLV